jgi:hypothetical protein
MKSYPTRYGMLQHISEYSLYPDKSMKECMLMDKVVLTTGHGDLIPQYEFSENRRKYIYSLSLYEDGALRKIALNDKTKIMTPLGSMEAELITFYQSGKLKRLFPLNGRISAYWDEDEEYKLATKEMIELPGQTVSAKIIAYNFYESGTLKSITLWPKEVIKLNSPIGEVRVRIGVSFYENGNLKSMEPSFPLAVQTPIGEIKAFDLNADGISGDRNSVVFSEIGSIQELITSGIKITVQGSEGNTPVEYSPVQDCDEDGIEISFQPLKIVFDQDIVRFNDQDEYKITENSFRIERYHSKAPGMCSDCSSCGACASCDTSTDSNNYDTSAVLV